MLAWTEIRDKYSNARPYFTFPSSVLQYWIVFWLDHQTTAITAITTIIVIVIIIIIIIIITSPTISNRVIIPNYTSRHSCYYYWDLYIVKSEFCETNLQQQQQHESRIQIQYIYYYTSTDNNIPTARHRLDLVLFRAVYLFLTWSSTPSTSLCYHQHHRRRVQFRPSNNKST